MAPPQSIEVTLSWNGLPDQAPVTFPAGLPAPDGRYLVAVQVDPPSATTGIYPVVESGIYPWQAKVVFRYAQSGTTPVTAYLQGSAQVVFQDAIANQTRLTTPLGLPGWAIAGVDRLVLDTRDDVQWVTGSGTSRLFHREEDGSYTNPEDFGTLQRQQDRTFTYTTKDQTVYTFNPRGLLATITDLHHVTVTYSYDDQDRLWRVETPDGGVTQVQVGGVGLTITEPGPRTVTLTQDSNGDLTQIADADGSTRTFEYDGHHHLTSEQWAPLALLYGYRSSGDVETVDRGLGTQYQVASVAIQGLAALSTDPAAQRRAQASQVDPLGQTTTYTVDERGRLLKTDHPLGVRELWQRDASGEVTVANDGRHWRTTYTYDLSPQGKHDLVQIQHPDGASEQFQYDQRFHRVNLATDGNGHSTQTSYNATGDVDTKTDALNHTTAFTYALVAGLSSGLVETVKDPLNHTTTYQYDGNRRLNPTEDALGYVTTLTYDANGNRSTSEDALHHVTFTFYDAANQLHLQVDAMNGVTTWDYDASGHLTDQVDPLGQHTHKGYDQRGWNTQVVEAVGDSQGLQRTTINTYDLSGNLLTVTKPRAYDNGSGLSGAPEPTTLVTTFAYDALNRPVQRIDGFQTPLARTTVSRFDANGNLREVDQPQDYDTPLAYPAITAPKRVTTHYGYDPVGRRAQTIDALGVADLQRTTTTTYDLAGNRLSEINALGQTTSYGYDAANHLTLTIEALGTALERRSRTEYDAAGNAWLKTDPMGYQTETQFDELNRPKATIEARGTNGQRSSETHYDAVGNVSWIKTPRHFDGDVPSGVITDPQWVTTSYGYDALDRRTQTIEAWGIGLLQRTSLTDYDADGHVLSESQPQGYDAQPKLVITSYAYDGLGRRTSDH